MPGHLLVSREEAHKRLSGSMTDGEKIRDTLFGLMADDRTLEAALGERHAWLSYNQELLRQTFSDESIVEEFVPRAGMVGVSRRYFSEKVDDFRSDMQASITRLKAIERKIDLLPLKAPFVPASEPKYDALNLVERLCKRFPLVAKQLSRRRSGHPGLGIENEYDVQYLLHAILMLFFEDIRPEEWTPSYAGGASRMDFLLKDESIVLETKMGSPNLGSKEIGDQLILDIAKYSQHPSCKTLVCMVYDPGNHVKNPRGLENDLSKNQSGLAVKVFVTPRWS